MTPSHEHNTFPPVPPLCAPVVPGHSNPATHRPITSQGQGVGSKVSAGEKPFVIGVVKRLRCRRSMLRVLLVTTCAGTIVAMQSDGHRCWRKL
eukprot:1158433-Pelagomonas_calceolata.AAC.12